jgi:drug/metabolite transporter (DMT)-like permease
MAAGAMMLWLASLGFGETWAFPAMARTWLVLAYLVALGSVALFVLFLYVMERWTASATVYALALMPVVAVALGAIVADESVTWELVVGAALVMAAVYVGALSADRTGAVSAGRGPDVETRPRGLGRVQEGEGTP